MHPTKITAKRSRLVFDLSKLQADSANGLPSEIQLVIPNMYRTVKGEFALTIQDLDEAVRNFDNGVARVNGSAPLPINFNHEQSGPAAGWITSVENRGKEGLWATVEWTPEGVENLTGKMYRFISFEYWFNYYEEPDTTGAFYNNVLEGAALTNIPLFRNLKPVMASAKAVESSTSGLTESSISNNIFIEEGAISVDLEKLRTKANSELSEDERTFVVANADKLTDDEKTKFEIVKAAKVEDKPAAPVAPAAPVNADKTTGIVMSKEEVDQLKADAAAGRFAAEKLERAEISASLKASITKGAIKPTQETEIVDAIMAARGDDRARLQKIFSELPENKVVGKEIGSDDKGDIGGAADQIEAKAKELMTANKELAYDQAVSQVMRDNPDLAAAFNAEATA